MVIRLLIIGIYIAQSSKEEAVHEKQTTLEEWRVAEEAVNLDELDPRIIDCKPQTSPMEELESFSVDPQDPSKHLQVGRNLPIEANEELKSFLLKHLDVFTWKHGDMVGIEPKISCHHLNIDPKVVAHRQKRRALNPERYEVLKDEVKKLIDDGFI
ncbi:unnamed protein product [Fraxinus pennsylvanica]|uniref:Uncharacterized protein n=1 Tax=Fraxinus pennsylvanica TaxID=56036 RepID=A0AAD1Z574_9LAMI|nr:unnamed protein product [Fraxinus pennsylvanica]